MSTAQFAAFSDNAIMFASIVYVLAFLAHLVEWVFLRSLPVPTVAAEEPKTSSPPASPASWPPATIPTHASTAKASAS